MMKCIFVSFLMLMCSILTIKAIPAKYRPFKVTNSDGTELTIVLRGDESFHFYTTEEGIPVSTDENGDYRLAPELKETLANQWAERKQQRNVRRVQRGNQTRVRSQAKESLYAGKKKGIVILVEFSDLAMKSIHTTTVFNNMFNEVGYSEDGHIGSVHDYFYDQSYGQLDLTFDVYGPITVSKSYTYYGANNEDGDDKHVGALTAEAFKLASQTYDINWKDYDWDGDGEVDQVYLIYAGVGEHASGIANTIWPHEYALSSAQYYGDGNGPIKLGGCTIDTYAMSSELSGSELSSTTLDGIGTACHEFSHCLGLPDFYDTSYDGGFGMEAWDVMDAGAYNGPNWNSECPAGYSAYERWYAGWLTPTELSEPASVTDMPCLGDEPVAYIIYNDGHPNEFFLLENRQNTNWFQYIAYFASCHGMLISHVDYNEHAWMENTVNNDAEHQRMTIVPASGIYGNLKGQSGERYYQITETLYKGHLFPGSYNATSFTNTSHTKVGGKLFSANTDGSYALNKPITDIKESDGLISFTFMGGGIHVGIDGPVTSAAAEENTTYFTLSGLPVSKPAAPGFYLERKGSITRKVFLSN